LINIAKNKILQNIHSGFEKQVLFLLDNLNKSLKIMELFPNLSFTFYGYVVLSVFVSIIHFP